MKKPIEKTFGKDFHSEGGALTLESGYVCDTGAESGVHERTWPDGWTVKGEIHEDYYVWVNEFEARHPQYGRVWGDFEGSVFADSEEAFQDFYKNFPPSAWDYYDI